MKVPEEMKVKIDFDDKEFPHAVGHCIFQCVLPLSKQ